jgi:two-component system sensor histidine kinase UhpB
VALVTLDGILLRRLPARADDATNLDIHGSEALQRFFAQPLRTTTLLRAPQPDSGTPYLYAAYRLKDLPMVATAGIAVADALEPWRARRAVAWEFLILTTLVVMILALALQRLYNRRWQSLQQLADARRVELETHEMLARQLLLAQEAERKRLASELHDGVGQGLSLLRNRIVLLRRTGLSPDADGHAQALLDHATESISDLRGVVQALRPMHLEELGPTSALNALVERVRVSSGLEVHHHIENVDDVVGGTAATHLYRIAQEAINNVLKHAGAKHLWVDVIRDINLVELSVRDDGRGLGQLAQRGIDRSAGLGLLSIAERCHILGAELLLQANEPAGTWLRVRLPIEAELGRVAAEAGADGA